MRSLAQHRFRRISRSGAGSAIEFERGVTPERFRARIALFLACALFLTPSLNSLAEEPAEPVLWREPGDIASRSLLYGSGGKRDQPHGTMVFAEEDHAGSNPKFYLRDQESTKWTAKIGIEAKPETAASHLLWAVGYFTDEDYFVPGLTVERMPAHLQRGENLVGPNGMIDNVRLERHVKDLKKIGHWKWKDNPFTGTRQFNGLRVMMALMNSWDLKDENNTIYQGSGNAPGKIYVVSDLGASFGTTGYSWTQAMGKGNLNSYRHSRFIKKVHPEFVDFNVPTRPALLYFFHVPGLIQRLRMRWIGKHISREDAKWMGGMLSRLSSEQIQEAFRSAGYSPQEVEGFTKVVEERIAELNKL
jgi:hypothetical protein